MTNMIIAIDGPAAAGKGTLAQRLAEHFDLAFLDTGLIYRAVGMGMVRIGLDPEDAEAAGTAAQALKPADMDETDLRSMEAGSAASKVSAIPAVREALLLFQREFANNPPGGKQGAVLDGRDIGTVICPEARFKLFVTASAEVRAKRRYKELLGRGSEAIYARVLEELKERDARDRERSVSPLEPAKDATIIDTSDLDADEVFATAIEAFNSKD